MKTFCFTTMIIVTLLLCSNGIQAQTTQPKLDQLKLMQQVFGTWEATVGKDTVEIWEIQQYGKAFLTNVSHVIKGKKTPYYTNNYCIDSKDAKFKGFTLYHDGRYLTWIALWTTEKRFSIDIVQNFKPETVLGKNELLLETPTKMTFTYINTGGTKTRELKFNKVK